MNQIRGLLRIAVWHSNDESIAHLDAFCPACDFVHSFNVDLDGHGKHPPKRLWTFNGNWDKPTFRASMLANRDGVDEHHPRCTCF